MRRKHLDVHAKQNAVIKGNLPPNPVAPYIAKVVKTHSDRNTCDIETVDGFPKKNVPVLGKVGLVGGAVYGEIDLPEVDDWVVIMPVGQDSRMQVVMGTIVPYLNPGFTGAAVDSASKANTTKLLEAGKSLVYRKIFKSGATVEVQADGTIILETPSGSTVVMDESSNSVKINGNLEVLQ